MIPFLPTVTPGFSGSFGLISFLHIEQTPSSSMLIHSTIIESGTEHNTVEMPPKCHGRRTKNGVLAAVIFARLISLIILLLSLPPSQLTTVGYVEPLHCMHYARDVKLLLLPSWIFMPSLTSYRHQKQSASRQAHAYTCLFISNGREASLHRIF